MAGVYCGPGSEPGEIVLAVIGADGEGVEVILDPESASKLAWKLLSFSRIATDLSGAKSSTVPAVLN